MWFGAGASLVRRLGPDGCDVVPAVSGLQLAAARLGWPMAVIAAMVSIHGRPVGSLCRAALSSRTARLAGDRAGWRTARRQVAQGVARRAGP